MKLLICTAIQKDANERPFYFPAAMESILALRFHGQRLDYFIPSGGDTTTDSPITRKYKAARTIALEEGYDALALIESDMIVPADALERLAALDSPIAYGLYCMRQAPHYWTAYTQLDEHGAVSIAQTPARARECFGKVIEVSGIGHGCTLIQRRVLETFNFRNRPDSAPDWTFAIDAQYYGLKQVCDLGVQCGHMDRETRRTYWPDPDSPTLVRIEAW